ncbi:MAG: hypothetical protein QME75_10525 [Deltaproteobacteria bacterium]|nr:hypothetical protein [Deltaproteobacteria bacterium]
MIEIDFAAALEPQPQELDIVEPDLPEAAEFDTQRALAHVLRFEQEIKLLVARSKTLTVIQNDEARDLAAEWGAQAKKLYKRLEELRHHYVDPHNKYLREVNNFFKKFTDPLQAIEKSMGRLLAAYRKLQENERRRKAAEQEAEARRLQEQLEAEAQAAAAEGKPYEPVTVVAPLVTEVPKVTRTAEGSAQQRKRWVGRIVNPELVPREYCEPSQKLINQAVRAGVREIPGCVIEEEYETGFRV